MSGSSSQPPTALQAHFLQAILPVLQRQARVSFRQHARNPELLEELTQRATAIAWQRYVRLMDREKDPSEFVTVFAQRACQAVRNGRHVTGQEKAKDAMSVSAQRGHGFHLEPLPEYETGSPDHEVLHALAENNTVTPPPDQAAFRIDYPRWLDRMPPRDRNLAEEMAWGDSTKALAARNGISPSRVSQKRREFAEDWEEFTADPMAR